MDTLFLFVVCVCLCHTVLSVSCSLVVTCWERAFFSLGSLVCDAFLFLVTFPYGVLCQVWYLIVSISDLCLIQSR